MAEFTLNNPVLTTYEWSDRPSLGTTATTNPSNNSQTTPGQEITLGGFSGLYYEGKAANGNLKFITHTDRGPNGEPTDLIPSIPGNERPFALPNFQPELVRFELDRTTGQITITERIGLKRPDGTALTGLPNVQSGAAGTAYTDEVAIDLFGNRLANDALGADLEGIVVASDGTFWTVDEYRPAIYHFDSTGQLIDRFIPKGNPTAGGEFGTPALPDVYAQRRNNRGFEAVALEGTKLYAFIQSAIDNPDSAADTTSRGSQNLRILEFDVTTQTVTGEYLYRLDAISGSGTARTDKIGDAVALGDGKFLVVERDDRSGSDANKLIYEIDLTGATNINSAANLTKIPVGKTIEQLSATELQDANLQAVSKRLVTNAATLGYTGVEKLEGLAVTGSGAIVLLNDNDFGLQANPAKGDGTVSLNAEPTPVKLSIIEPKSTIRFSQFNASLNRNNEGDLVRDLSTPDNAQAKSVAEIIQRSNPDVLLINEFDYVASNPLQPVDLFKQNYLAVSQNGANPVDYPYVYIAPSNTGVASGLDLDNDGNIVTTVGAAGYGNDAFGFGNFPGQFGMLLLSKYPIDTANVRTFQNFLWKDMPDSLLPTISTDGSAPFYSSEEQAILRLSSKSHWDVPLQVNGKTIHALVSHPTPPTFDGVEDRNGKRNHDEIRFWSDYIASENYIYDDQGQKGGLNTGSSFVIMGDQNADPVDGDSFDNAIRQLLENPKINTANIPTSPGAPQQSVLQAGANLAQKGNPSFDTADFADTAPGNLRVDYVLPSSDLTVTDSRVFWPSNDDPLFRLVGTFDPKLPGGFPSSDHRLIWADIQVTPQRVLTVLPTAETPSVIDSDDRTLAPAPAFLGDADDPAVWVNPNDAGNSLVLGTLKNGGLATFNLDGTVAQDLSVVPYGDRRYNNVDVLYDFNVGGKTVDLAIATDRRNDTLTIWSIDPATRQLTDITAPSLSAKSASIFGIDNGSKTAYGLATYTSANGKSYAFISQRQSNQIAQLELIANSDGTIDAKTVRTLSAPIPAGKKLEDSQFEGMVVDKELGYLYAGQEQRGIWKFQAEPTADVQGTLIQAVKPEGNELTADVEGLTIYYGKNGTGYLLASSQGDSTYAVYSRDGDRYLGSFAVGSNGAIDGAQESDGTEVINLPLGDKYPQGLFITQDGNNLPAVIDDDENINTNFKFVPWEQVAQALTPALAIDTSFNPRNLKPLTLPNQALPNQALPNPVAPRNLKPLTLPNQVASGDTTQNSTVLWTRSEVTGAVKFEYSTRSDFSQIAGTQTVTVTNPLQPVKVQVEGLTPNTPYYYRVTDAAGVMGAGRFNTAAEVGTRAGLRFGAAGDWRGELSPYPAIANADQLSLDFFILLGDTIYADYASPALNKPQAETLEEYRLKHDEVYSQRNGLNTWGDLRSSTSILATIDDHEVINDFEGGALASSDPRLKDATPGKLVNDTALYDDGLQAFQEYNPIRDDFYGETGDARTAGERKLYRYNTYGSDAASFVLDARSFRDKGLVDVTNPADVSQVTNFLVQSYNPDRTFLGRQQIADLKNDLLNAEQQGITWKYIVAPEPIQNLGVVAASDRFEGYAAERTEILKFINENDISNVVFIAADIHSTLVNNLTYQTAPGQAQIATSAFEITTGSVAFDAPFGPTVVELASALNLVPAEQKAFYDLLPVANDTDSLLNDKDDFIKQLVNSQLNPFGYDPLGLNDNLAVADGKINAKLLQGDYLATQTYGWTQFDIDPATQKLTVTTYGIPYYTEAELKANPSEIASRTPTIVSQFEVQPALVGNAKANELKGSDGADEIKGLGGNDTLLGLGGDDKLSGGEGDDLLRGGAGKNTLLGGQGGDRFAMGEGTDTIVDFNAMEGDRIALINVSFPQLTLTQGTGDNAKDTLIQLTGSNNLLGIVKGIAAIALSPAVFTSI